MNKSLHFFSNACSASVPVQSNFPLLSHLIFIRTLWSSLLLSLWMRKLRLGRLYNLIKVYSKWYIQIFYLNHYVSCFPDSALYSKKMQSYSRPLPIWKQRKSYKSEGNGPQFSLVFLTHQIWRIHITCPAYTWYIV